MTLVSPAEVERRATAFAAEFLAPVDDIGPALDRVSVRTVHELDELRMTWGSANPPWWCGPGSAGAVGLSVPGDVPVPQRDRRVHGHRPGVDAEQPHLVADIIDRLVVAGYPPGELDDITLLAESQRAAPVRYRRPGAAFEHGLKPGPDPLPRARRWAPNATPPKFATSNGRHRPGRPSQRTPSIRTTLPAAAERRIITVAGAGGALGRIALQPRYRRIYAELRWQSAKEGRETDSVYLGRSANAPEPPTSPRRGGARTRTGSPNQPRRSGPLDHPPRTGIVPRVRRR